MNGSKFLSKFAARIIKFQSFSPFTELLFDRKVTYRPEKEAPMKEILRIKVYLTGQSQMQGASQQIVMLPFTGACDSPLFRGKILPGGVDTQLIEADDRCALSARYMLEGVDGQGNPCRVFIENNGLSNPGQEMVTRPSIRTDSPALRWLETAQLAGKIEHAEDHIEIVISAEDEPGVEHIVLPCGGLKLAGRWEKKGRKPAPVVMMLHGFGGDMWVHPDSWFQHLSDTLTAARLATLRFDFNGHGRSEGRFRDMTPYNEIENAAAFLQYALSREDVTEVYLLGHSQGGVVAGMLAGYYHDVIKKLALLAPAASLKTDAQTGRCMAGRYDPQHIPAVVDVGNGKEVGGLYFRMAQTLPIYEVTGQYRGDALVVLAGRDNVVSRGGVAHYAQALPQARLVEKATLDHGLGGREHAQTMREIADFFLRG